MYFLLNSDQGCCRTILAHSYLYSEVIYDPLRPMAMYFVLRKDFWFMNCILQQKFFLKTRDIALPIHGLDYGEKENRSPLNFCLIETPSNHHRIVILQSLLCILRVESVCWRWSPHTFSAFENMRKCALIRPHDLWP